MKIYLGISLNLIKYIKYIQIIFKHQHGKYADSPIKVLNL